MGSIVLIIVALPPPITLPVIVIDAVAAAGLRDAIYGSNS
jgi:hypothetical protein